MLDVADHVAHPLLSPKVVQRLIEAIIVPAIAHKAHVPFLQAAVPRAIGFQRHLEVATREETEHEAAGGTAPVLPLPTVDEDRGTEKDSDEDHLDCMLDALPPGAPGSCLPTLADPQPLANAIRVRCVIPEDMGQRTRPQEILQKRTRPPEKGTTTWDGGQGHHPVGER